MQGPRGIGEICNVSVLFKEITLRSWNAATASLGPIPFCSYTKQRQCIMRQWRLYVSMA